MPIPPTDHAIIGGYDLKRGCPINIPAKLYAPELVQCTSIGDLNVVVGEFTQDTEILIIMQDLPDSVPPNDAPSWASRWFW